jgi:hypothetical protein
MHKNANPAAVATASGASGFDLAGRQIGPVATPERERLQGQRPAAPISIVIAPTARGRKWRATLDDKVLCVASAPLVTAARLLIARGFDPTRNIEMWRANATVWALRGKLGAVASSVLPGERKAQRPAKNDPPVRFAGNTTVQHRRRADAR